MEVTGRTRLSVLIPTHGRPALLGRTLESLSKCAIPHGYAETVVIENGPKSGAEGVVSDASVMYPRLRIRYMHVERANKSYALNEALEVVKDGLVVFFDDDVRLSPAVLKAYAEAADDKPRRAFFGGPIGVDYEVRPPEWLIPFFPPSARGNADASGRLELYLGFNWAAYADELRAIGGFNPAFGPGSPTKSTGQEGEMHLRLLDAGFEQRDVPEALVWHYVPRESSSPGWVFRRMYRHGKMAGRLQDGAAPINAAIAAAGTLKCGVVACKKGLLRDRVGFWRAMFGLSSNGGKVAGSLQAARPPRFTN